MLFVYHIQRVKTQTKFCTYDLISNLDKQMQWKLNKNRFKFHNHILCTLWLCVCVCEWYSKTGLIHVNTQTEKESGGMRERKHCEYVYKLAKRLPQNNDNVEWVERASRERCLYYDGYVINLLPIDRPNICTH